MMVNCPDQWQSVPEITDEEVDKLNTQMEKEIRGDGDGDK